MWARAVPLPGSSAGAYLEKRGLIFPPTAEGRVDRLRCIEDAPYWDSGKRDARVLRRAPVMLAPIVDGNRVFRGLHQTFIDLGHPKGKLQMIPDPDKPSQFLPSKKSQGSKQGNHVELIGPTEPRRLVLGEGNEKTIAVWMAIERRAQAGMLPIGGIPFGETAFWSACDLGNLGGPNADTRVHPTLKTEKGRPLPVPGAVPDFDKPAIVIPDSVTDLVLIGDTTSDPFTTQLAMCRAAARYARPGRTVRVAWSPEGADFDDLWREIESDAARDAVAETICRAVVEAKAPAEPQAAAPSRELAGEARRATEARQENGAGAAGDHSDLAASAATRAPHPPAAADDPPPLDPPVPPAPRLVASSPLPFSESSRSGGSGGNEPPRKGGADGGGDDELNRKLAWLPQTDLGNVERFVARYGHLLKWCVATGWHYWDGKRWARKGAETYVLRAEHATVRAIQDEAKAILAEAEGLVPLLDKPSSKASPASGEKVVDLDAARAKKRADKAAAKARKQKAADLAVLAAGLRGWGRKSETKGKMSLSDRAKANMEVHHEQFDADPWKINVQNGTLVARRPSEVADGEPLIILKAHDPADFITKISPVVFDKDAECPQFDAFFLRVQPTESQRRFLMQWHGYSLTGDAEEQKMAVYFGGGRNGKGTLMETCAFISGDYAESVSIDTFLFGGLQKSGGAPTPDLAKLPGVRFLRAGEPDKGAKLNEGLIKKVTGGDPIDARNLNSAFFTFYAQFKLTIACNHKPRIGGTDEGIWSRMIQVPWLVQIPKDERDPQLKNKLRAEASGILNRLLDGLRDYLECGLQQGREIEDATAKWRRDSDAVGRFMEQCTVAEPGAKTQSSVLWQTYTAWATVNAGPTYSNKGFTGILDDRGYQRVQDNVMVWVGVKLTKSVNDFVDHHGQPLNTTQKPGSGEAPDGEGLEF
jgi:putative DNA primase/helicase